jgi:hypothetical protein
MGNKERKIILLTDIIEKKVRKIGQDQLEYYQRELEKLNNKMFFIRKEIDLTNFIIDLIGREKIMDMRGNYNGGKDESET